MVSTRCQRSLFAVALWVGMGQSAVQANDVVYVGRPDRTLSQQRVEAVANFYGLQMGTVFVSVHQVGSLASAIRDPEVTAVVVDADVLPLVSRSGIVKALTERRQKAALLIAGITQDTASEVLSGWSGGAVTSCPPVPANGRDSSLIVSNLPAITRTLGGHALPLHQRTINCLTADYRLGGQTIISAEIGGKLVSVFAKVVVDGEDIFFAADNSGPAVAASVDPYREQAVFASLAPELIFLRYAARERAWHRPNVYANLTIDDAWLRLPYGNLRYDELFREAQKHKFHVTVAFVPWNFDRSETDVAALFRAHPDTFSISIHGNNHDHQEFGPYATHPLNEQIKNIKQALARMAKFRNLTRVPYDEVMIFPHSICPEATLAALKRYNFLATANSTNVPSDVAPPADADFSLRTVTEEFANFPTLRRYSAENEIPESQLAIDSFLGNPMLFYVHEGYFANGADSFNKVADLVARIQPDVRWKSLGYIAQHLYLEKRRNDGSYDVRLYTARTQLQNDSGQETTFFVEKAEDFAVPFQVFVDGRPLAYRRTPNTIEITLRIGKRESRDIAFRYQNDLDSAKVDVSKPSMRINAIRLLSDFRDDFVSRSRLGRWFIHSYAKGGGAWNGAAVCVGLLLGTWAVWALRKRGHQGSHRQRAGRDEREDHTAYLSC